MGYKSYKYFILLIAIFIIQSHSALFAASQKIDSTKYKREITKIDSANNQSDTLYPWRSTPYLAVGYGYPQGMRAELGYNFSIYLSLGITFGIYDYWIKKPDNFTFGFAGRIFLPTDSDLTPYLLIAYGERFSLFGNSDTYTLVSLGMIIPIQKWLQLRPELGLDFTSKYISGGRGFFGESSPVVRDENIKLCINLSIEIDIITIFR